MKNTLRGLIIRNKNWNSIVRTEIKFKFFIHLLKIASDHFFLLAEDDDQLAILRYIFLNIENQTNSISIFIDKIVFKLFFPNIIALCSVDPDQPASKEAGWQDLHWFSNSIHAMLHY